MSTQCITPITVFDKKTKVVNLVPCGKCYPCLLRKRHEWFFRLSRELDVSTGPCRFVTLTYTDEELPVNSDGIPVVSKRDCQLFLKRLRTTCERRFGGTDIRYFLISEYGPTTLRPHYHLALFNLPYKDKRGLVPDIDRIIAQSWNKGEVTCTLLEPPRIGYLAGYFFGTAPDGVPAEFPPVSFDEPEACYWKEVVGQDKSRRLVRTSTTSESRLETSGRSKSWSSSVFCWAVIQPELFEDCRCSGIGTIQRPCSQVADRQTRFPRRFRKAADGRTKEILRRSFDGKCQTARKNKKTC